MSHNAVRHQELVFSQLQNIKLIVGRGVTTPGRQNRTFILFLFLIFQNRYIIVSFQSSKLKSFSGRCVVWYDNMVTSVHLAKPGLLLAQIKTKNLSHKLWDSKYLTSRSSASAQVNM